MEADNKQSISDNDSLHSFSKYFPNYPVKGIDRAWTGSFRAFQLTWIELEILYASLNWISLSNLKLYLESRYSKEDLRSESSFYRIINGLIRKKYLKKSGERGGQVKITDKGSEEIGRFERYHTEKMIQRIHMVIIKEVISQIRNQTGCLHNRLFVSYTYKDFFVKRTLEECSKLDKDENLSLNPKSNYFLYLNEDQIHQEESEEHLEFFKISSDGMIDLKENLAEIFIGGGILTDLFLEFKEKNEFDIIINELKRIIKSNGTFYFVEQISDDTSTIMKYFSLLSQLQPQNLSQISKSMLSKNELNKILKKYFPNYEVLREDLFLVVKAKNK